MELSGHYSFHEDFFYGKNEGYAYLMQNGNKIHGNMVFTEHIEGENTFKIRCDIEGEMENGTLNLETTECQIIEGDKNTEYVTGALTGTVNSKGEIVGSTVDKDGINGVFIFKRND